MGRGRSGLKRGAAGEKSASSTTAPKKTVNADSSENMKNFSIAFDNSNLSFAKDKSEWGKFERSFGKAPTREELRDLDGYVATGKSFTINKKLYTPGMGEKTLTEREAATVKTLDRMVDTHVTPKDAKFVRYVDGNGVTALLGMDSSQVQVFRDAVSRARRGDTKALDQLSKAITGSRAHSASFTSSSAAHEHLFSSRLFKREINVPKGTKAFATNNQSEHEVIFGRNMNTVITGISFDGSHMVLHENFVGYKKRRTK